MVERRETRRLIFIALYLSLAALFTFYRLLPLSGYDMGFGDGTPMVEFLDQRSSWWPLPMPDLMLCLTLAWVLRRPDLLPALVIVLYFLFEDLLVMRPPALWALIVLLGTEFLRRRAGQLRGHGFVFEYALVSGLIVVMFLANRAMLAIVMVPLDPLGLSFLQIVCTVLSYPLVVMVSHVLFGLRKPASGEVDALGQKL